MIAHLSTLVCPTIADSDFSWRPDVDALPNLNPPSCLIDGFGEDTTLEAAEKLDFAPAFG
jgi:hypothetical protein